MVSPAAYGSRFHEVTQPGSEASARVIVPLLVDLLHPRSVIDVGCGPGAWLAEFKRAGVAEVLGIDNPAAANASHLAEGELLTHDLRLPLPIRRRFDLAVCVEVAEHLPKDRGVELVAELVRLAPVVAFSAAVPHQGGTGHINEQWPEYWAELFVGHGQIVVDCLRRQLWAHPDVEFWYAQNLLLFARPEVVAGNRRLGEAAALTRSNALAQVHPQLYLAKICRPELTVESVSRSLRVLTSRALGSGIRRLWGHVRRFASARWSNAS